METAISIQAKVAEEISKSGPNVQSIVVDQLVEVQVSHRVELIKKGLTKLNEAEKELKKISKPDGVSFTSLGDGATKLETYSEKLTKEIKSAEEKVNKIRTSIDKALNDNTTDAYNKLSDVIGK